MKNKMQNLGLSMKWDKSNKNFWLCACAIVVMICTAVSYSAWIAGNNSAAAALSGGKADMVAISISAGSLVPYDQPDGTFNPATHVRYLLVTVNGSVNSNDVISVRLGGDALAPGSSLFAVSATDKVALVRDEYRVVPGATDSFKIILDSSDISDMGKRFSFSVRHI